MRRRRIERAAEEVRYMSRFKLAMEKQNAERGKGILAGLTRFERSQVTQVYEKNRRERRKQRKQ